MSSLSRACILPCCATASAHTLTATREPYTPWVQYSVSRRGYTVSFPVPGIGTHFLARGARIDRIFNSLERGYGG